LTWALATLKDADDRILIDDFMRHVRAPTAAEMETLKNHPLRRREGKNRVGHPFVYQHLTGLDLLKKYLYEPTCTICGLYSGYIGQAPRPCCRITPLPKLISARAHLSPDLVLDW